MIEIIGLAATVLAVAGVITNNRKIRVCFVLWMFSNAMTGFIHAEAHIWSLLLRDTIFFILAIEGWIKWGRK